MVGAILLLLQAATEAGAAPPPEVGFDIAKAGPAGAPGQTIVVTGRTGDHPARLGKVLPEAAGPVLPKAALDLGDGVVAGAEVRTHPREGVGEMHFTLKVPF